MSKRFLLKFSYIGTSYTGSQRQLHPDKSLDSRTVQGVLDLILKQIWKSRASETTFSCRTDTGVHAIASTAHFDFFTHEAIPTPTSEEVTMKLNKSLTYYKEHSYIRILNTRCVPNSFHCRHDAKSRSYLYRLAVVKPEVRRAYEKCFGDALLPIVERCRCDIIKFPFDVEVFAYALHLFNGEHDFATFMGSPAKTRVTCTVQNMQVCVNPGSPLMDPMFDPLYGNLDFYHISFTANSFLYRQIRRMVGSAIYVGLGIISVDEIKYMLNNPGQQSWNVRIHLASPNGLYLREVTYADSDLICE